MTEKRLCLFAQPTRPLLAYRIRLFPGQENGTAGRVVKEALRAGRPDARFAHSDGETVKVAFFRIGFVPPRLTQLDPTAAGPARRLPLALARSAANFGAESTGERVAIDANMITGGGVTAGIDFALRVGEELRGRAASGAIQLMIE